MPVKTGCVKPPFFAVTVLQHPGGMVCALLRLLMLVQKVIWEPLGAGGAKGSVSLSG